MIYVYTLQHDDGFVWAIYSSRDKAETAIRAMQPEKRARYTIVARELE